MLIFICNILEKQHPIIRPKSILRKCAPQIYILFFFIFIFPFNVFRKVRELPKNGFFFVQFFTFFCTVYTYIATIPEWFYFLKKMLDERKQIFLFEVNELKVRKLLPKTSVGVRCYMQRACVISFSFEKITGYVLCTAIGGQNIWNELACINLRFCFSCSFEQRNLKCGYIRWIPNEIFEKMWVFGCTSFRHCQNLKLNEVEQMTTLAEKERNGICRMDQIFLFFFYRN